MSRDDEDGGEQASWDSQEPIESLNSNFSGFEQSLVDNVAELTKVITSNTLKIDLEDFEPHQMLTPKHATTQVISLASTLDHELYPVNMDIKFVGQKQQIMLCSLKQIRNLTDMTVSVYVHSSNPHWRKVNELTTSLRPKCQNPFEQSVKLTEILPGKSYYLPLALSRKCKIFLKSKDIR